MLVAQRADSGRRKLARRDPMKELVVGLDGSRDSRRALRWAPAVEDRAAVPYGNENSAQEPAIRDLVVASLDVETVDPQIDP
jgi:hypothetical protein